MRLWVLFRQPRYNKPGMQVVSGAFEIFLGKHGIALPPLESSDAKEIMTALAQTAKLAYLIEKERVRGIREESDFQHRVITKWQADLPVRKDVGIPLSELFAKYHDDWAKDHLLARSNRKNTELKRLDRSFTECFAKVPGVKELSEEMAKEWREYIQYEFYDDDLSNKTVNNYLETMSAVFNYGSKHKNKYTDGNPFKGIRLPEGVASERSRIFEPNELQEYMKLLAELHHQENPEMTWLPLIMMFSGMRCNEISQLFVDDLQEKDGIYFFRITEDVARNQHVKSLTSKREVPIHNTLKELGLLDYVAKMKDEGHHQIFPNCQYRPGIGLYYDANMSFQLNIPINLIDKDKKLRLYSLRANFRNSIEEKFVNRLITAMDSDVSADIGAYSRYYDLALNNILGHAIKGTVGDMVYRKRQLHIMDIVLQQAEYHFDISKLKRALNKSD
jgi:integrase